MSELTETSINLLLFSVGSVRFGIDIEQAAEITEYPGEESDELVWFHTEMEYSCTPVYTQPVIISVRTEDSRLYRVVIDKMEDVTEMRVIDIRPFPSLLEPFVLRRGMWGIVESGERMVLLVDFQRLLRYR